VAGAGAGLVLFPGDRHEDRQQRDVSGPLRDGVRFAAIGAAGALVASALASSVGGQGSRRWTCSLDSVLSPPAPATPPDSEWLGYARVHQGWIGLVLPGPEARAIWEAAIATLGVRRMPPPSAAALLQHLGVAAFPAHPPASAERPATQQPAAPSPLLRPSSGCVMPAISGRRILDLGRVVAAPFAARVLEDLGAHVWRVRPPDPASGPKPGENVIDLADAAGAEQIAALAGQADLVVENFRPRGWDIVQAAIVRKPRRRIAIRGFDGHSPLRNWKMYGFLVEGFFGIGVRPCAPDGRADGGAAWDRLSGLVAAAAAIRQLAAAPTVGASEISQIGLARMWITARRAAE
jgi:hypothetical protein